MNISPQQKENHYVLIVHGTFSAPNPTIKSIELGESSEEQHKEPDTYRPKWFQLPNPAKSTVNFCTTLNKLFEDTEYVGAVWRNYTFGHEFSWNGENDHKDRLDAAKDLHSEIEKIIQTDPYARIHLVAHSHGGNVILNAMEEYVHSLEKKGEVIYKHFLGSPWGINTESLLKTLRNFTSDIDNNVDRNEFLISEMSIRKIISQTYNFPENKDIPDDLICLVQKSLTLFYDELENEYGKNLNDLEEKLISSEGKTNKILKSNIYLSFKKNRDARIIYYKGENYFSKVWAISESSNRIGKIVFMGTPFYRKQWIEISKGFFGKIWNFSYVYLYDITAIPGILITSLLVAYIYNITFSLVTCKNQPPETVYRLILYGGFCCS